MSGYTPKDVLLRIASVAAFVVLLTAACGGGSGGPQRPSAPKLPHALAQRWAQEADAVAAAVRAHDGCGAQELARTLATDVVTNRGRVPVRLRADLMAAVTTLVDRISCVQTVKPKPKGPKPKPPPHKGPPKDHGHHHGHGDGG